MEFDKRAFKYTIGLNKVRSFTKLTNLKVGWSEWGNNCSDSVLVEFYTLSYNTNFCIQYAGIIRNYG